MKVMWIKDANYCVQPIREMHWIFPFFLSPKNSIHQNCGCELHFITVIWFALRLVCKQSGDKRGKPRHSHECDAIIKLHYTRR